MKSQSFTYTLSLIFFCMSILYSQTYVIQHDFNQLQITEEDGLHHIDYLAQPNLSQLDNQVGQPDLPVYIYKIVLPAETSVADFTVSKISEQEVTGRFNIKSQQPLWYQDAPKNNAAQSAATEFQGKRTFPDQIVQYTGTKYFNGIPIAHFAVHPVKYDVNKNKLYFINRLEIEIETGAGQSTAISPDAIKLPSALNENIFDSFQEKSGLPVDLSQTGAHTESFENVTPDLVHRYVIITTDELAADFEALADWKTRKGVPAVIRTMDWIRSEFPHAVDDAERMRNYIRWSYLNKGTKYVLLGGDLELVPTRLITTGGYTFAADYYFSDLDGTWNANQNDIFGEAKDNVDGYPEVYVGRLPVEKSDDVSRYLTKLFRYEKLDTVAGADYPANVLYTASNLSKKDDGKDLIMKHIDPVINPLFKRTLITEDADVGSDPQVVLDALSDNYGLIFTENHGAYHTIRPGGRGSNIYSFNLNDITNHDPAIWYVASCYTNDIRKRSFSEMYLLSENGGGVAYIGNSSYEYPFSGIYLQKEFYELIFKKDHYHLAEAHFLSRLPYLGYLSWEGPSRIIVFSTVVLGDPELPVWTKKPKDMSVEYIDNPDVDGKNKFTVRLTDPTVDVALENARVVLYRKGEIYDVKRTDESGIARFFLDQYAPGKVFATMVHHNYKPVETGFSVPEIDGADLTLEDYNIDETYGTQNSIIEPGEAANLSLKIKNEGERSTFDQFKVNLDCTHELIHFDVDSVLDVPAIDVGETAVIGPFQFNVSSAFPKDTVLTFDARFSYAGRVFGTLPVLLDIHLPVLKIADYQTETVALDSSFTTALNLDIINAGRGAAAAVKASLKSGLPEVQIITEEIVPGDIAPGTVIKTQQSFVIEHTVVYDSVELIVTFEDMHGVQWHYNLDFQAPQPPANFSYMPYAGNAIMLSWESPLSTDILGYHIYRKQPADTAFVRITDEYVHNAGYFLDETVQSNQLYQYNFISVDSSVNYSAMGQDTLTAWPALPYLNLYPQMLGVQATGSEMNGLTVFDIDGQGGKEIIASGGYGVLGIYSSNGELLHFINSMKGHTTAPAVGNVYGDDAVEVVVSTFAEGVAGNFIYIIDPQSGSIIHAIDLEYRAPTSVVLEDLNYDGYDEIIVLTHANNAPSPFPRDSRLFVWKSTGTEWTSFDSWPEEGYIFKSPFSLGMPAVGDLNNSGVKNVVVAISDGNVYAFDPVNSADTVWTSQFSGFMNTATSLADLNSDKKLEILVASVQADKLYVLNSDGKPLPGWENGMDIEVTDPWYRGSPAIASNIDRDPEMEIIYAGRQKAYIFNLDGTKQTGWPVDIDNGESFFNPNHTSVSVYGTPVIADIDQNGVAEIIFTNYRGIMHALDVRSGKNIMGFPIDTNIDIVHSQSPVINDVDNDGDLELIYIGHNGIVHVWDAPGHYYAPSYLYWYHPYGNEKHSGRLDTLHLNVISAIDDSDDNANIPDRFYVKPNYPNPFNPSTTIRFGLPSPAYVELSVYNLLGQKVSSLISELRPAGRQEAVWNGTNQSGQRLASGLYIYRLEAQTKDNQRQLFSKSGKMILLK